MSLDDLSIFERVVTEGSFTGAARSLDMAKSTVSKRISALEERLGVRLLHRTTRSVKPTDDGRAFFERCQRIVLEAREAEAALTRSQQRPQGRLRITAARLFGQAFLTGIIADFVAAHPEVSVELVLAERSVDLVDEGFDLAIRLGSLADSSLVARRLGAADMCYVAAPQYLTSAGSPSDPDELTGHRLIVVAREGQPARWPFAGQAPRRVSGRVRVNSLPMARDLALLGCGIAFVPRFLCREALAEGRLSTVLDPWVPPALAIAAVYPSSRHLSAKVRAFIDTLVAHTADDPPWTA